VPVPSSVRIRAIGAGDASLLREFDDGLSAVSRQFRYLGWMPPMSPETAAELAAPDRLALVAVIDQDGRERIIGDCRVTPCEQSGEAELSIAVADEFQGAGLGRSLLERLLVLARERGQSAVVAEVRCDNHRMLRLLRRLHFAHAGSDDDLGVLTFTKDAPALERAV
jgi:acetyltransferase